MALDVSTIVDATRQTWPPFVLVEGLLLIGQTAGADGLFEAIGCRLAAAPLSPRALLAGLLALVAAAAALLNLDTSVVFLTPVLVHAARRRGVDERPFLYGAVFMSNSASVLLPGSNLTNLLVLGRENGRGVDFAVPMLPAWLAACAVTTAFLIFAFPLHDSRREGDELPRLRLGFGGAAALAAAGLVLTLRNPAPPVLAIGMGVAALGRLRPQLHLRALGALFAVAVTLGTLARAWHAPAALLADLGRWPTAGVGALAAILVNNLPASALLSAQPPPHPRALLLGLDLGPNLAVTGSLSALLWLQAARSVNARPSIALYSRLGLVLTPLTLAAALAALSVLER